MNREPLQAGKVAATCSVTRWPFMLENGADICFIQAILGHVKLDTTQIYTQVSIKKLKEIHTLTHPAKGRRTKVVSFEEPEATKDALFSVLAAEDTESL